MDITKRVNEGMARHRAERRNKERDLLKSWTDAIPVCTHEEVATVITPVVEGRHGIAIDSIEEKRCMKCGTLVGFAS